MSTALLAMLLVFVILTVLSVPMSYSIGLASIIALIINGVPMTIMAQRIFASLNSFTLLAVPLFILCGDIMAAGGIAKRLVAFCSSLLGWIKGGLAYMTLLASAFFGAISGSSLATTRTIGGIMYPELIKSGYIPSFAAALGATGGTLGILIPPSIAFVVFGTQTGTSVTKLFTCGIVVGLFMMLCYDVGAAIEIRHSKQEITLIPRPTLKEVFAAFKEAVWGLLAPVIILGGIYGGIFTPTEAAVVACVYCIIIEKFVYKDLNFKKFYEICHNSAFSAAGLLLLIAVASLFSWLMSIEGVSRMISTFVSNSGMSKGMFLLVSTVIYLILGMLIDTTPIIILTSPILFPVAQSFGIDPVWFGVLTVVNLSFGLLTPPFGCCIFMSSTYSKQKVVDIIKSERWIYITGFAGVLIVTYLPQLYMWVIK